MLVARRHEKCDLVWELGSLRALCWPYLTTHQILSLFHKAAYTWFDCDRCLVKKYPSFFSDTLANHCWHDKQGWQTCVDSVSNVNETEHLAIIRFTANNLHFAICRKSVTQTLWVIIDIPVKLYRLTTSKCCQKFDQPTNQPTNQSINQSINQSTNQSINQPTNQSINQWINQQILNLCYTSNKPLWAKINYPPFYNNTLLWD